MTENASSSDSGERSSATSTSAASTAVEWARLVQNWARDHILNPLVRPQRMLCVGLDWPMVLLTVVATCLFYTVVNWWLCGWVDQAYANLRLQQVHAAATQSEAADRILQLTGMDKSTELRAPLGDVFTPTAQPPLATTQFVRLMGQWGTVNVSAATSVASNGATSNGATEKAANDKAATPTAADIPARERLLKAELTGHRTGSAWWAVNATTISGEHLVSLLEQQDPVWARSLEEQEDGVEKRLFLVRLADLLSRKMRFSIREVNRWNGSIQWWTVFAMFLIIGSVVRRAWTLRQVGTWSRACLRSELARDDLNPPAALRDQELAPIFQQAFSNSTPPNAERAAIFREQFNTLRGELDARVYGTLAYILGVLPSLGFIGTVLGMGSSLLEAEGLFTSRDKQRAIGNITQQLGFAFDTTFVALLASILAGVVVCWMRTSELELLRTIETSGLERIQQRSR